MAQRTTSEVGALIKGIASSAAAIFDAQLSTGTSVLKADQNARVQIAGASGVARLNVLTNGAATLGTLISGTASQTADYILIQDSGGNNLYHITSTGSFMQIAPATEVLTAGATITANACGGVKRLSSASALTTNTTDTITAPAAANAGCVMTLVNVNASDAITLDKNANILLVGGADLVLGAGCSIIVVSTGASGVWKQISAQLCSS